MLFDRGPTALLFPLTVVRNTRPTPARALTPAALRWAPTCSAGPCPRAPRSRFPRPRGDRPARLAIRCRSPGVHPALRPRRADDEQVHRTTARRPRRDPFTEPPSGVRRQPLLRGAVQTLKYHPGFPGRFHDITAAIAFCRTFFPWYNTEHRHGGIAMLTPDDVHHNRTQSVLKQRGRTLQAAWTRHPERFVRGIPQPDPLPQAVWINPPGYPQQEKLLSKSQSSLSQSR